MRAARALLAAGVVAGAAAALMLAVRAGGGAGARGGAEQEGAAVRQEITSGPVSLRLALDRTEISAAETVTLRLTVAADEGWVAEAPEVGERLGEFAVGAAGESPAVLDGSRLTRTFSYELEPFLPGEYAVPAIDVPYRRAGGAPGAGAGGVAATQPLTVRVVSLLPEGAPLEAGPARGVVTPAEPRGWVLPLVLAAALGAGLSAAGVLAVRRRRSGPARERPALLLTALLARAERGEATATETCDQGASILRRALGLRIPGAPAMTTEQLLAAAGSAGAGITAHELAQVREFLLRCDAARYAGEPPERSALLAGLRAVLPVVAHLEISGPPGGAGTGGAPR